MTEIIGTHALLLKRSKCRIDPINRSELYLPSSSSLSPPPSFLPHSILWHLALMHQAARSLGIQYSLVVGRPTLLPSFLCSITHTTHANAEEEEGRESEQQLL